ncbi:efflux RND transporter periplasmic adaptor subunit [Vibrio panuliri]|uniref:Efflux transporter periplasmic adaptor subunit n=1 Tax=Vibrio panuliri TaxID=1381081 RepID=A0ABX3FQ22_9VIBR|nr:efflux RND transporter periplasmic adaptor subunit [Vibrio panuliri]KAB1458064.1 efflux RND transporter periplasmic adaptor subunit [Vibrio panuliri]OLQ95107.1 efflux transporter periplasmic adaptor subunit [Vibrio panuliri]
MNSKLRIASAISLALWLSGCDMSSHAASQNQTPPAVPVNIIELTSQPQAITMELPGRSRAYMEAEVRPQVNGIVLARSFTEGGHVEQGQSLYQIDDATYAAALISTKAELKRAEAALASTSATAKRFKELLKTKAISQQDFDQAEAAYLEAKASVAVAKAAINNAEINLAYTKVEAPISGQISMSSVTPGALVTANQGQALAKISQLDPINVDISQSSTQMLRLKQRIASGQLQQPESAQVRLILEDGSVYQHLGSMKFAEVTVNETTGAVSLRAEFPNPDGLLLPGMFVRTIITVGTDPKAILVPQKAITRNPRGQAIAMVVDADNKVESRVVTTAEAIDNQWLVTSGLKEGDKIVVEGLQKIRPGVTVAPSVISDAKAS